MDLQFLDGCPRVSLLDLRREWWDDPVCGLKARTMDAPDEVPTGSALAMPMWSGDQIDPGRCIVSVTLERNHESGGMDGARLWRCVGGE